MRKVKNQLERMETRLLEWAGFYSHSILRMSIGIIYVLFGVLKFFPNHSPAERLAVDTIEILSFGFLSGSTALLSLAALEAGLGLCLLFNYRLRLVIYLAVGHMLGTFLPLYLFPEQAFAGHPLSLSLLGQYIIKNFVVIGAFLVLYAKTVRKESKIIRMSSSVSAGDKEDKENLYPEKQERKQMLPGAR